jgi:hypothetical protein
MSRRVDFDVRRFDGEAARVTLGELESILHTYKKMKGLALESYLVAAEKVRVSSYMACFEGYVRREIYQHRSTAYQLREYSVLAVLRGVGQSPQCLPSCYIATSFVDCWQQARAARFSRGLMGKKAVEALLGLYKRVQGVNKQTVVIDHLGAYSCCDSAHLQRYFQSIGLANRRYRFFGLLGEVSARQVATQRALLDAKHQDEVKPEAKPAEETLSADLSISAPVGIKRG